MADAVTVGTILDTTSLELLDHAGDVHGDGAELGVRHEATGTKDTAKTANLAHHVGRSDACVKVDVASLDLSNQVVGADDLSASSLGLTSLLALGEDGDAHVLADAVGQGDGATDVLVGLTGVDAQADGALDGLVKLGGSELLHELHGGLRAVELALNLGCLLLVLLSVLRHFLPPCGSRGRSGHAPFHKSLPSRG